MTDDIARRSGELFDAGYFCAESVLLAIAESKKIESDWIPRIATGFCSGVSRTYGMCGAVSGAIMGINLASGRNYPKDSVDDNYQKVQELVRWFEKRFGSTNCKQLIGCDLNTEAGQRKYIANNLHANCKSYTEEATRLAMALIEG